MFNIKLEIWNFSFPMKNKVTLEHTVIFLTWTEANILEI